MLYDAIDSVFLAASDLDAARRPYERLGLQLSPALSSRCMLQVGGPENPFSLRFIAGTAAPPLSQPLREALAAGRAMFAVALRVADVDAVLGRLEMEGVHATKFSDGDDEMAWLPLHEQAGADLVLVRHGRSIQDRAGLVDHAFPLRRLDHLAAVTHDLEAKARFWSDALGVPVVGEVVTPTLVIRQLRIGDAVLELLGPATSDSQLLQRPPGLAGMAAWEVANVEDAVGWARAAGFTVTDPAAGVLPGTRTATIQGSELAGVNMQLLQYV